MGFGVKVLLNLIRALWGFLGGCIGLLDKDS